MGTAESFPFAEPSSWASAPEGGGLYGEALIADLQKTSYRSISQAKTNRPTHITTAFSPIVPPSST
jgi:hypothetical protein